VAIVVCLDGVTSIAEPEPRFPTAYWIAGFVDYIARTGHTAPELSAYFSWPASSIWSRWPSTRSAAAT